MKLSIINNSLFGKVFVLIFVSISIVLGLFSYQATLLQKKSILSSLESKSKSIADSIKFVNTESMIIDDEIKILEFIYDFVQSNKNIHSIIVSRKNGNSLIASENKWLLEEPSEKKAEKKSKPEVGYEIVFSPHVKLPVFKYSYEIVFSGVQWGWLNIELSLDEYYEKIDLMYNQFIYFALVMIFTTFIISYFIAKMISKPIVRLENISKEIANGNLSKRADIETEDEIGKLALSFNKMVNNLEYSQRKLKKSHDELETRVDKRTKELKELNETLESKVQEEIVKQKEQEQILIQQSKLAAMGEMIGNIAHQWRQPLNALGLVMQNINFSYQMDELDDEFMERSTKKVNLLTKNMSKTIDDFRNFFKPNKEKSPFYLDENVVKSINMVESTFEHNNIKINHEEFKNIKVYGFPNEFSQTILNILNNAKDALIENKVIDAKVEINLEFDNNFGYVVIEDNAGGIPQEIIERIFDPYFTTKEEGKGTGIGLYMSKIIIEQNMSGKLDVENMSNGAKFIVKLPLYKELV